MQPLASGAKLLAYQDRLQGSHDFTVYADILNLDDVQVGSCEILDGQVNVGNDSEVRRTCTLTLSDPEGALDFAASSSWDGTALWVDRLVRIRHVVNVPPYGDMTAVPFVGVPVSMSRAGAEVQVELQDKAALALRGSAPLTVAKGANAVNAIVSILRYRAGETHFRFPTSARKLSKAYAVGWADEASPWLVARQIARAELGLVLSYSCDGYAMLRTTPQAACATFTGVTEQAESSVDFTTVNNYVRVQGKKTATLSVAAAPASHPLSAQRLTRHGVPRYLPLSIVEDNYTTKAQTAARANAELSRSIGVADEMGVSVVPMFHLDADDVARVWTSGGSSVNVRMSSASIPLGVGGDMTIGHRRWVSRPVVTHR